MRRRVKVQPLEQLSEINLTPLMDLTFILLITFIITFPLMENGIPVKLPMGEGDSMDEEAKSVRISMNIDEELFIDDRKVSMDELDAELRLIASAKPDAAVMVRADENLAYGKVVRIMDALKRANLSKMALVTASES